MSFTTHYIQQCHTHLGEKSNNGVLVSTEEHFRQCWRHRQTQRVDSNTSLGYTRHHTAYLLIAIYYRVLITIHAHNTAH